MARVMAGKKGNYQTKKVRFGGKELMLYSIDGVTWSSRPEELHAIIERHSNEQAAFTSDLKGEERDKTKPVTAAKPKKFQKVHDDAEIDEVIEDDADIPLDELDDVDDVDDIDEVDDRAAEAPTPLRRGVLNQKPVLPKKPTTKPVMVAKKKGPKAPVKASVKVVPKKAKSKATPAKAAKKPTKSTKTKKRAA